jgi:phenazine biosynthesis protein phzE
MACLQQQQVQVSPPLLTSLHNDDEIIETLARRNECLSSFWFFRQQPVHTTSQQFHVTLIDNEDEFIWMLNHMLRCMGFTTSIVRHHLFDASLSESDLVIVGPGPGNPNDEFDKKMHKNREIIRTLRAKQQPFLCICLGHQLLLKELGFEVKRKERPLQGTQRAINLNGRKELVGFYNTFAGVAQNSEYRLSILPGTDEVAAIHGSGFIGFQFHPESVLSRNGYTLLKEAVHQLLQPPDQSKSLESKQEVFFI